MLVAAAIVIVAVTTRLGPTSVAEEEARTERQEERLKQQEERLELRQEAREQAAERASRSSTQLVPSRA